MQQPRLKAIYKRYAIDPAFDRLRAHGPPKRVVPGIGSMNPLLVFVGEAPGRNEATTRKPFMGRAGVVLNGLLASVGLTRADIFLTNVVKYRPTVGTNVIRNRTPTTAEIEVSLPYLLDELAVFDNVPVVTLGNVPLRALWDPTGYTGAVKISDWHGRGWYDAYRQYVALYHPAVAVYEPSMNGTVLDDMAIIRDLTRNPTSH